MHHQFGLSDFKGHEQLKNYLVAAAIGDLEFLNYSIESGRIGVDETYDGKPTALSYACMRGHQSLVQLLITKGANVNYLDKMGGTPLHYAAMSRCPVTVELLLQQGASPTYRDKMGRSALSISAAPEGCAACLNLLKQHTCIQPMASNAKH